MTKQEYRYLSKSVIMLDPLSFFWLFDISFCPTNQFQIGKHLQLAGNNQSCLFKFSCWHFLMHVMRMCDKMSSGARLVQCTVDQLYKCSVLWSGCRPVRSGLGSYESAVSLIFIDWFKKKRLENRYVVHTCGIVVFKHTQVISTFLTDTHQSNRTKKKHNKR